MADQLDMVVDSRALYLKIDFCRVPLHDVKKASIEFIRFVQDFYQDKFVVSYGFSVGNRYIFPKDICHEIEELDGSPEFVIEALVKTNTVNLKRHIRQFRKTLFYDASIPNRTYSLDFDAYYEENIKSNLRNEEKLKTALLKLFSEKGRKPVSSYHAFDSQGYFYSKPDCVGSSQYHGTALLSIGVGCLNENLSAASEIFALELKQLCNTLRIAGGHVSICPFLFANGNDPYSAYFQERVLPQDNEAPEYCNPRYWNKVSYLSGVAWANVLSPEVQKRIKLESALHSENAAFYMEKLSSGGVFVQINKSADSVDVDDLLKLKAVLYPVLYPGKSSWHVQHPLLPVKLFPRSCWEMVPILPNEINIKDGFIIFEKKNCPGEMIRTD